MAEKQGIERVSINVQKVPHGGDQGGGKDIFMRPSLVGRSSITPKPGPDGILDPKVSVDGDYDDDGHPARFGGVFGAASNIVTAVIGAGVLSLSLNMAGIQAWCTAQVGWPAGVIMQLMFASITLYCSLLLCDCYRYPQPDGPERNYTYSMAVRRYLGRRYVVFCATIQYLNLFAIGVGYTVTAGLGMVSVYRAQCYHKSPQFKAHGIKGTTADHCHPAINKYMIIFGAIQMLFIQIPNLEEAWWVSVVAAILSVVYSTIGLGLSIGKATQSQEIHSHGTLSGVTIASVGSAQKCWDVLGVLGDIAFAYGFAIILIEISDTVKGPRGTEAGTMKKATILGLGVTSFFYMAIGTIGYAAFGNDAPGNLLTGFGFFDPYWLLIIANLAIAIHLIGGYQVFTQPLLAAIEARVEGKAPNSWFFQAGFNIPVGKNKVWHLKYYILVWRTIYVVCTTLLACLAPFFNDIVGILGAVAFWPLLVFLPISMHIVQRQIPKWSTKWILLQCLSAFGFLITVGGLVGAVAGIVIDTQDYTLWHANYSG